eukprot:scaffold2533_cov266-Chaetoceros_neogracile.AAC.4
MNVLHFEFDNNDAQCLVITYRYHSQIRTGRCPQKYVVYDVMRKAVYVACTLLECLKGRYRRCYSRHGSNI